MEEVKEKESIKDKVEQISVRSFTVGSCPEKVYQRFRDFCESNAKNIRYYKDDKGVHTKEEIIYHIGLKQLLDIAQTDAKSVMLFERILTVEQRMDLIDNEMTGEEKSTTKLKKKTFG